MKERKADPAKASRDATGHDTEILARAPEIRRALLEAYDSEKRDLPWRGEEDPYRIWVSEVMLQQTRVDTVIPYYKEWLARFPDMDGLARADEEEVLRAWQGLGYYSRARNLWRGARMVRERLGGRLPGSARELKKLPGVGEYTAGAVASIAFGEAVPAVDGNVRRVLSRLFDLPDPSAAELRTLAAGLLDRSRPGDFNQALMELGAPVCTPRSPACTACSLAFLCRGRERGTVEERPARKGRRPVPETEIPVLVALCPGGAGPRGCEGPFFLRRRPAEGLLAGMWEFPGDEGGRTAGGPASEQEGTRAGVPGSGSGEAGSPGSEEERVLELARDLGLLPKGDPVPLPAVSHAFTHLKVRYRPFLVEARGREEGGSGPVEASKGRWVTLEELRSLPLPVAQGKILEGALDALSCGDFHLSSGGDVPVGRRRG